MTAELAVALPAVVLLIAMVVGALAAGGLQVRLEQAAAQGSRYAARGEPDRVAEVVRALAGTAAHRVEEAGDLVCVTVSAAGPGPLPRQQARSCALSTQASTTDPPTTDPSTAEASTGPYPSSEDLGAGL